MDRAKSRLSFISVFIAALLVACFGILAFAGLGYAADTAQADPIVHTHDDVTFEPWSATDSLPGEAGNWYLTQDVVLNPWCTDLQERRISTYNDTNVRVTYDDCNPFALMSGDFGDIANISLHTSETPANGVTNYINTMTQRFSALMGHYTIPKDGTSYVQSLGEGYSDYYTSARTVYNNAIAGNIGWSSDYSTYGAVIGANYPYILKGSNAPDVDYQALLARLFGFSDKAAFMECAQSLADACASPSDALLNGCFVSNGYALFPIVSRNGLNSPVYMFVFVDTSGYVSVWVHYVKDALKAINYNADYNLSEYSRPIENRLYCKNVLFVTGSNASWKVPTGTKLCLNGHSITYQSFLMDSGTYGSVIDASNSTFDLYDCDDTVHYYYVDADSYGCGCGVVVDSEAEAIAGNAKKNGSFKGGYLTGGTGFRHYHNNSDWEWVGGAIFGDGADTHVTMHGGTLIGNRGADSAGYGAVAVDRGTFTMKGGNVLANYGYAFYLVGYDKTYSTTLSLEGGLVRHNSGGVYAYGRYDYYGYGDTTLNMQGKIEIYDNYKSEYYYEQDTYYDRYEAITLYSSARIRVTGQLQNEHPFVINDVSDSFTIGLNGNGNADNFTSPGMIVTLDQYGEAKLVMACTVTYNANGATSGTAPVDDNVYLPGDEVTILGNTGNLEKAGHTFAGWKAGYDETVYNAGQKVEISYSMQLVAVWEHLAHDDIEFEKWTPGYYATLPTYSGNYYLDANVELYDDPWTVPEGTTNLCLHGCDIIMRAYGGGPVIIVPTGSTLNIYDCDNSLKYLSVQSWRGQYATMGPEGLDSSGNGFVKVTGGSITGGYADAGAGILISGGTVNMYGGNVVGNKANDTAGGVYVESGSFEMHGGKILANKAGNSGAGVCVNENGAMSLSGDAFISGNTTGYVDSNVYLADGKAITITGALTYTTPISVKMQSRGVLTSGWSTYMDGEDPADFFTSEDDTCEIILFENEAKVYKEAHEHNGVEFEEWTELYSLPSSGNYYLTEDVTVSSTTTVTGTLNLCLNGHGIKKTGSGSVFSVSSGKTFNVYDHTATEHKFTVPNPKPNGAGVATVNDKLTGTVGTDYYTFTGGYITGGTGGDGAGIRVYGTFNLYGGNIIGNNGTSGDANGGAIKMENGSAFTMYGGNVIYNHGRTGGALFVESNSVFTMMGGTIGYNVNSIRGGAFFTRGTVYIRGGEISNNYNNGEQAIAFWGGTIEITGGVIKDNLNNVGGVISLSALSLGGNAVIKDNKDGSGNQANLYVKNGGVINIVSALDDSVKSNKIGVTMQNGTGVFANGWTTYMSGKDPADYFFIEDDSYSIGSTPTGEIVIGTAFEVTFVANGHGVAPDRQSVVSGCLIQEPAALTDDVYTFAGWYKEAGLVNEWAFDVDTVSADTTLYAKWTFVYNNITFEAWTSDNSLPTSGDYYLTANVEISSSTIVSGTLNLCLNGHGVIAVTSDNNKFSVITVNNGATFNLYDGGTARVHGFTVSDPAANGAGLATVNDALIGEEGEDYLTFVGGYITGGYGAPYGGGVYVNLNGRFNMYGGTIIGNKATSHGGGVGISAADKSSSVVENFVMYGGAICYNQANWGGAIGIYGNVYIHNEADVSYNVATSGGGGIELERNGKLYMDGGLVHDNVVLTLNNDMWKGGGVHVPSGSEFHVSGAVQIVNNYNKDSGKNNVYVRRDLLLTIGAELAQNASVGVTMQSGSGVFTSGWSPKMGEADPADYFSSDNANYAIGLAGGEATLLLSMTATAQAYNGDYDGAAHGITVTPSEEGATIRYGTQADAYTMDECPTYSDAGTYTVYYQVTKADYTTVCGSATVTINAISVNVLIVGKNGVVEYTGAAQSVSGYDAMADNLLYNVATDIELIGAARAERTDVGRTYMGLSEAAFANRNDNFNVTFIVGVDGFITVNAVNASVTAAPISLDTVFDGEDKPLVSAGKAEGGAMAYALGEKDTAPAADAYSAAIPMASEIGNYYVWYKVSADGNHIDSAPACVRVTIAAPAWVTLSGVISQNGESVSGATVTLKKGNQTVDSVITGANGSYKFIVPIGVYSVVAEKNNNTETTSISLFKNEVKDLAMSGGKNESKLEVKTEEGEEDLSVAVDGLEKEAQAIREKEGVAADQNVSVVMTVEQKTEEQIAEEPEESHAKTIQNAAQEKNLEFYEIKVEKTVNSVKTLLEETSNVLEIAIPYAKAHKRGLTVYSYHGDEVVTFVESNTKEAGTFRVDKENKIVYVYTKTFSTYAIGYAPYYRVATSLNLGSYTGTATATLTNQADGTVYTMKDADPAHIVFTEVPKGQYVLTVTWTDGAENTISMPFSVGPADPIPMPEPEAAEEEKEEVAAAEEDLPFEDPFEKTADDLEDVVFEDKKGAEEEACLSKKDNDRDDA